MTDTDGIPDFLDRRRTKVPPEPNDSERRVAMNTSTAVATRNNGNVSSYSPEAAALMESVVIKGDLSKLSPAERGSYYMTVCKSVGLNPLTQPFAYMTLSGKLVLYALRNCTDQLRTIHDVSVVEMTESDREGVYIVTCKVKNAAGRTDMAKGAVTIKGLQGEALANAMMKAETKAKRRATLSLCGLGFLDETEIEDIPAQAKTLPKKDSRDVYAKMQKEIDGAASHAELKKWGEDAKERIEVLPADWQDILRLRYQEKLADLRQHAPRAPAKEPEVDDVPEDPEMFFKWADDKLAAITDPGMLEPTWEHQIEPHLERLIPPDAEHVHGLYRKHERRLA